MEGVSHEEIYNKESSPFRAVYSTWIGIAVIHTYNRAGNQHIADAHPCPDLRIRLRMALRIGRRRYNTLAQQFADGDAAADPLRGSNGVRTRSVWIHGRDTLQSIPEEEHFRLCLIGHFHDLRKDSMGKCDACDSGIGRKNFSIDYVHRRSVYRITTRHHNPDHTYTDSGNRIEESETDRKSMKQILLKHYEMYPLMQIQDMVKLIYQNEFAGGHFVSGETGSLKYLKDEYCSLTAHSSAGMLFEDIGNSLCRINLSALLQTQEENRVEISTVNKFFITASNSNNGDISGFEEKIAVFLKCCKDGLLPFDIDEVRRYMDEYKKQGYPPVSHSDMYRKFYNPAYRVVGSDFRDFYNLFCKIEKLLRTASGNIIVAIDGNSGSGKSALSFLLSKIYECNVFHMDDFFLRPEQKTPERLEETGGNVDYERFRTDVAEKLISGQNFTYRKFDCQTMTLTGPVSINPMKLNIVEGSYSMHPSLIEFYDLKIFLHIDKEEQSRRIMERNKMPLYRRFIEEWIPKENQYFEEFCIRDKSDLVFP